MWAPDWPSRSPPSSRYSSWPGWTSISGGGGAELRARKSRLLGSISTWGGILLLVVAIVWFVLDAWPRWQPELREFWDTSGDDASLPILLLSLLTLAIGYYFAPSPWRRIVEALRTPGIERGNLRRNWYVTQMGQYVPGKLWMVLGRLTFLRANGTGTVKGITAFVLENIYMMVALTIMTLAALPFLSLVNVPFPVVVALWVSAGIGVVMLFAPGIQRKLARFMSHRFGTDVEQLPSISHRDQAIFVGYHLLSWSLRSLALYFWFRGFGVSSDPPLAMVGICLLAAPAAWFIALGMVFIPGGLGIREGIQGLLLAGFVHGGVEVATVIALGQRAGLMLVEGLFALEAVVYGALRRRWPATVNHLEQLMHMCGNVVRGFLALHGLGPPPSPINVTFSVTMRCQSRCRTCFIWKHEGCEEMDLETIERLFRGMGWTYFFNVSGGEPFLRSDLPEIVRLACRHLRPAVVHVPTNALAPERIERMTRQMLSVIAEEAPGTILTLKPSFDSIGRMHDEIRGVPGNFGKLLDTLERLKRLREEHSGLHVGVGTVISRMNADRLGEIIEYARSLDVDTYINEVAEEREEFFNLGSGITPEGDSYAEITAEFKAAVLERMSEMRLLSRITTALRVVYYDIATRILREKRQVLPCAAGILNVHVNADGSIWPCAVLAYKGQMGRVDRETDFRDVWRSERAREVRRSIRRGECFCPLANQAYSNILLHPPSLMRTLLVALRGRTRPSTGSGQDS